MNKSDMAVKGARAALVDNRQKRILIMAAKEAFAAQLRCGMEDDGVDFGEWRKGVCWDVAQKSSFRLLNQRDYGLVLGELRALSGAVPATRRQKANARVAKSESGSDGDRRRALYALRKKCVELADVFGGVEQAESYSLALLRKIHKLEAGREWSGATAKQLWQVMFTMINRARAKTRKDAL